MEWSGMKFKDIAASLEMPHSIVSIVLIKCRTIGCYMTQKPWPWPKKMFDHANRISFDYSSMIDINV